MHLIHRPALPYWGHIPDGVHPGTVIEVNGFIPHHCNKFEISLYSGHEVGHHAEKHSNIALQVRPKLHGKKVICNSRQYGNWGYKEKHRDFHHVHHGSTFDMMIVVEHQHYRIMINGHTICHYQHRVPLHEVRILNIEGHLDVHRIEYRHQHHGGVAVTPYPTAPVYPGSSYQPAQTVYPSYNPAQTVYPSYNPAQTIYPATVAAAAPVYVAPTIQPGPVYVPPSQTIIIEEDHHHHRGGLIDAIFGDHHHGHHGHHGHHHHKHHY